MTPEQLWDKYCFDFGNGFDTMTKNKFIAALAEHGEAFRAEAENAKDAERFAWWFSADRSSNGEIADLLLRQISGEQPSVAEWRTVIDRARSANEKG